MSHQADQDLSILTTNGDASRATDQDARDLNITGARGVADVLKTTLGPKGMDKLIVNSFGHVILSNDGHTILDEMQIVSPAGNMVAEVARIQEEEAGDGTTSAVVFSGELLAEAQDLLDMGIHPSTIAEGYYLANSWACEELMDVSQPVDTDDDELLEHVARTSMTGKSAERYVDELTPLIVDAVRSVAEETDDGISVDLSRVEIEVQSGQAITDSTLLEGVVASKEPVHEDMPLTVEDAKVMLLYKELEVDTADVEMASITDPTQRLEYIDTEESQLAHSVEQIAATGADVVFFMRGVDNAAADMLLKEGILGVNRIKKSDLENMGQVLEGSPVPIWDLETVTADDLGRGSVVRDDQAEAFYVTAPGATRVTLLVRGSIKQVADEMERSITDALHAVAQTLSDGRVLPGGGATEIELARRIRTKASGVEGREQLAVEAFADALEVVPRLLAENAGCDPIDALVSLRAAHAEGRTSAALDVLTNDVVDAFDAGIVESLHAKETGYVSATEVSALILNIDDVMSAGDLTTQAEVDEEDLGGPEFDYDTPDMGGLIDADDWLDQ
ncbi:thermosome subunit alpha [Salinigranum halophilum]|uniref:thermosome subunit alpha n=1 Tax=Salinigranum halophilum TaxID=2565931 RepID=UPI0010A89846|nr:thermosome subunit alpha [Salinigranum halophilum]